MRRVVTAGFSFQAKRRVRLWGRTRTLGVAVGRGRLRCGVFFLTFRYVAVSEASEKVRGPRTGDRRRLPDLESDGLKTPFDRETLHWNDWIEGTPASLALYRREADDLRLPGWERADLRSAQLVQGSCLPRITASSFTRPTKILDHTSTFPSSSSFLSSSPIRHSFAFLYDITSFISPDLVPLRRQYDHPTKPCFSIILLRKDLFGSHQPLCPGVFL